MKQSMPSLWTAALTLYKTTHRCSATQSAATQTLIFRPQRPWHLRYGDEIGYIKSVWLQVKMAGPSFSQIGWAGIALAVEHPGSPA
jgi:hypothetical protein